MKLFESMPGSPKKTGLRHIETHFRRRIALLDQNFDSMERYETDAKRIFESQFERTLTRQQAIKLAERIASNYVEEARDYNKTTTQGPRVIETMPQTLAFRNERAVRQLFWHKAAAENDLQDLYGKLDDVEAGLEKETQPKKVRQAHQEARKHEAYVRMVIEVIEKEHYGTHEPDPSINEEDRDLATRLEFGNNPFASVLNPVLSKLIFPLGHLLATTKSQRVNALNKIIVDPTGKARFNRPVYLRDMHPQWYVGERESISPQIAAKAEMLRPYQTGKLLVNPGDFHELQDRWIAFRMTHLKQMASRYRGLKEALQKKLQKME